MKTDIPLRERRRIEREQQAEIRAILAPRHFAAMEEEQAIAAYWLARAFEAGPALSALLARMGCGSVSVPAPVDIAEPEPVAPAPVPEPLPVRPGAPDVPFDLRQRFGLHNHNGGHPGLAEAVGAGKPKPSLIAIWYGSFDAWVEREVLPGVESGALAPDDMVEIVACLRRWEHDGTWGQAYAG